MGAHTHSHLSLAQVSHPPGTSLPCPDTLWICTCTCLVDRVPRQGDDEVCTVLQVPGTLSLFDIYTHTFFHISWAIACRQEVFFFFSITPLVLRTPFFFFFALRLVVTREGILFLIIPFNDSCVAESVRDTPRPHVYK